MDASIKALHKNIAEWMAGPTGSVCIHVALILALLFLVDFSSRTDKPESIEITYLTPDAPPLEPEPPSLLLTSEPPDLPLEFTPPEVNATDLPAPPEVMDFSQPDPLNAPMDFEIPQVPAVVIFRNLAAGPMQHRLGAGEHEKAGRRLGGEGWQYAELSVKRALEWLRLNQNVNGSWGSHDPEAMTGLAVLTFLAHGETTASEAYGESVTRGLRYLVARQNEEGAFAKTDTTAGTYSQAICVYALSEAYGMTRIPTLKPVMEKGVEVLIQGQQPQGGFDYRFAKSTRRDTSLGGWCCQALRAAFIAGAENPRLQAAMDLAVADMKSVQKADGSFYYSDAASSSTHSITAVAVLSMQLMGHERDAAVQKGLDFLRDADCNWKRPPAWPMYAWYYIAQTKFHQGGGSWTRWNNQFAPQFILNQNSDGSWDSAGLSLKPGTTGRENMHPVYATTLAALTLQIYYRFLPTYQPVEQQAIDQHSSDDAKVEIL